MKQTVITARSWLAAEPVILDTETTGLGEQDEICEIALIDSHGTPLLNCLIKPVSQIPAEATAIHGITNDMVEFEADILQRFARLSDVLANRTVLIYNKSYDIRLIEQSLYQRIHALKPCHPQVYFSQIDTFMNQLRQNSHCVMELYAEHYGQWDDKRNQYKWQKLTNAASHFNANRPNAHRALVDCLMTLDVVRGMAALPDVTDLEVTDDNAQ